MQSCLGIHISRYVQLVGGGWGLTNALVSSHHPIIRHTSTHVLSSASTPGPVRSHSLYSEPNQSDGPTFSSPTLNPS
jgi:hypothetical protein